VARERPDAEHDARVHGGGPGREQAVDQSGQTKDLSRSW
jgi:hypothetical protein